MLALGDDVEGAGGLGLVVDGRPVEGGADDDPRIKPELGDLYPFNKGIGLAAPQIGVPRAMAVVKPANSEPFTLINPVCWSGRRRRTCSSRAA
jgi:peptide deformylase